MTQKGTGWCPIPFLMVETVGANQLILLANYELLMPTTLTL